MHWMELINNSKGKYSFTMTRKELTQNGKNKVEEEQGKGQS